MATLHRPSAKRAASVLFAAGWMSGWLPAPPAAGAENPESIRPPGTFRLAGVLHDPRALSQPHDVEVQGKIAYVPGKGGTLALIDVSEPARPRLLSYLSDPVEYEEAETVLPMGDVLLLGARDFFSLDVSDPARPRVLKKIEDRPRIDKINGMARRGRYVFSAGKSGFISVFDVGNPADPVLHDVLDTRARGGLQSPHDVAVSGDRIIVVNSGRSGGPNVQIYRVADPRSHELLPAAAWELEGSAPTARDIGLDWDLKGANRVAVWGSHAAVGAYIFDRVAIFDLADPRNLLQLANMPVCDIDATGMTVAGRLLFVSGGECVEAIDVSDPANPVSVAQYRGGRLFPTRRLVGKGKDSYGNGHDLVYRDGFLYVTAQNDDRLGILELIDPRLRRLADWPAGGE